jgi:hypothetical protein
VPTTAQALQPVAGRLVDSPLRNGAASAGACGYRALAHHNHHNYIHGGGDGDTDLGRLDDIADDDEADFTDTDALLEYLLRDRRALDATLCPETTPLFRVPSVSSATFSVSPLVLSLPITHRLKIQFT